MTDGYQPEFDIDREYGEEGERTLRSLLGLDPVQVEVKRKRRRDEWFYVEVAQLPQGAEEFKRSGINVTKALMWAFVIGDTGVVVLVPTQNVRRAARSGRPVEESDGDNPTKGRLVGFVDFLTNEEEVAP